MTTSRGDPGGPRVSYVLGTSDGGTGRHVAMLARGSAAAGLGVSVFGPDSTLAIIRSGRQRDEHVRFETIPITNRPHPLSDLAAARRLRRLLTETGTDVVHAHGTRAGALAALALGPVPGARWPGLCWPGPCWPGPCWPGPCWPGLCWPDGAPPALVVTVHNTPPASASGAAIYGLLERLVASRADVALCVSSDLEARMRRRGAREVGRAVVAAPLARSAGRRPADLPPGPLVLAAGRLAAQKGFGTLITAATRWRDRRPQPLLVIAGAGPLAGELAELARDLGVRARLPGRRDDIADLLAAADVFALPSRWEGQPLILQEALRAGRPIVATDVGGVRDLTGDDAAILVRADDPAAFAAAVLSVLDDDGLAARLGRAAAQRAAALPTESDAIAAVIGLYNRLRPAT